MAENNSPTYKLSIMPDVVGRIKKADYANDNIQVVDLDIAQLARTQYLEGIAAIAGVLDTSAPLVDDEKTHRLKRLVDTVQYLFIDIDQQADGSYVTRQQILDSPIADNIAILYPSSGYTANTRKWHAVLALDTAVNYNHYKEIHKAIDATLPFETDTQLAIASQVLSGCNFYQPAMAGHTKTLTDGLCYVNEDCQPIEAQPFIDTYEQRQERQRQEQLDAMQRREQMPVVSSDKARQAEINYVTTSYNGILSEIGNLSAGDRNERLFKKSARAFGFALAYPNVLSMDTVESDCIKFGESSGHDKSAVKATVKSARRNATARTPIDFSRKAPRTNNHKISVPTKAPFGTINTTIELAPFTPDTTENMPYISDYVPGSNVDYAFKSPLGSGKTELVKRHIENMESVLSNGIKALYLTNRRSLLNNASDRLNFENYQNLPPQYIGKAQKIVCSFDSAHKLNHKSEFDLIIIDEIETFLRHGFGGTFKTGQDAQNAFQIVEKLLSNAGQVIILDAHMTDTSVYWLRGIRYPHKRVMAVNNEHKTAKGSMTLYQNKNVAIGEIIKAIDANNGTVFVPTSGKGRDIARLLQKQYGKDSILHIWARTSHKPKAQKFFNNPNEEIKNYRCVIYSPSVETGLDIQANVAAVIGIFHNKPLVASAMMQMMLRCRNARKYAAYVQAHKRKKPLPTTSKAIYEYDLDTAKNSAAAAGVDYFDSVSITLAAMAKLRAKIQADENRQTNDLISAYCKIAENEGFTLSFVDTKGNKIIAETMKAIRELIKETDKELCLTSEPVDRETFDKLVITNLDTEQIHAGFLKWRLQELLGVKLAPAIYDLLHKKQQRGQLYTFDNYMADIDASKARDRDEIETGTLLHKRRNHSALYHLRKNIITAVFGDDLEGNEWIDSGDIVKTLQPVITSRLPELQRYFDRRYTEHTKATTILRAALTSIGVKMQYRQIMQQGKRFYQYRIDREHLDTWKQYLALMIKQRLLKTDKEQHIPLSVLSNDSSHTTLRTQTTPQKIPLLIPTAAKASPEGNIAAYGTP